MHTPTLGRIANRTLSHFAALLIDEGRFWEPKEVLDLLKEHEYAEFTLRSSGSRSSDPVPYTREDTEPLVRVEREHRQLAAKQSLTQEEGQRD
jgi:hypothetical protein